jgi:hypothetical protein
MRINQLSPTGPCMKFMLSEHVCVFARRTLETKASTSEALIMSLGTLPSLGKSKFQPRLVHSAKVCIHW